MDIKRGINAEKNRVFEENISEVMPNFVRGTLGSDNGQAEKSQLHR
ncbi:hypothetical protein [uncultured Ilyobacter sp.]|nr:hypothetical protein [uncultured Ilyobacter sp.]